MTDDLGGEAMTMVTRNRGAHPCSMPHQHPWLHLFEVNLTIPARVLREGRRVLPPLDGHGPWRHVPHPVQERRRPWRGDEPPARRGVAALAALRRRRRRRWDDCARLEARREDPGGPRKQPGHRSLRRPGGSDRRGARHPEAATEGETAGGAPPA